MSKILTPSIAQAGKLDERLHAAARKAGFDSQLFQEVLGYSGTELEDDLLAVFIRHYKKARGIVSPVSAQDTKLVPSNWKVKADQPEGDVDLAKLDYSLCPVRDDEEYISGKTMMARAKEDKAIGSLGFVAALLKAQDEGKEIFPVESRGQHYFIMPLTELQDDGGRGGVASFHWSVDLRRWVLRFLWLYSNFRRYDRFVRRSENQLSAA